MSLIAHWPLYGDGQELISGHDASIGNIGSGITWNTDSIEGSFGTGGKLTVPIDNTDSLITKVFGPTASVFSISCWVNMNSYNNYGKIIGKANGGSWSNSTTGIWTIGSGFRLIIGTATGGNLAGSIINADIPITTTGVWIHLAFTSDGTTIRGYMDGILQSDTGLYSSLTEPRLLVDNDIVICGPRDDSITLEGMDGKVSQLKLYDHALSQDEIDKLSDNRQIKMNLTPSVMNTFVEIDERSPVITDGLVYHYPLDSTLDKVLDYRTDSTSTDDSLNSYSYTIILMESYLIPNDCVLKYEYNAYDYSSPTGLAIECDSDGGPFRSGAPLNYDQDGNSFAGTVAKKGEWYERIFRGFGEYMGGRTTTYWSLVSESNIIADNHAYFRNIRLEDKAGNVIHTIWNNQDEFAGMNGYSNLRNSSITVTDLAGYRSIGNGWKNVNLWNAGSPVYETADDCLRFDNPTWELLEVFVEIDTSKEWYLEATAKQSSGATGGFYLGTRSYDKDYNALPGHPGTWDWFGSSNVGLTTEWQTFSNSSISGAPRTGEGTDVSNRAVWHPGTKYAKIQIITNYNSLLPSTYVKDLKLYYTDVNTQYTDGGTAIEEATTNVIPDGDFSNGLQNPYASVNRGTIEIVNDYEHGGKMLKHVADGTGESVTGNSRFRLANAVAGEIWTNSIWVKTDTIDTVVQMYTFELDSADAWTSFSSSHKVIQPEDGWSELQYIRTLTNALTTGIATRVDINTSPCTVHWRNWQLEKKSYSTSFVNGTKSAGNLSTGDLGGLTEYTVFGKFLPRSPLEDGTVYDTTPEAACLFQLNGDGGGFAYKFYLAGGVSVPYINTLLETSYNTDTTFHNYHTAYTIEANIIVNYIIRKTGTNVSVKVYQDGVLKGTHTFTEAYVNPLANLRSFELGGNINWDGVHSDLSIFNRYLSDTEVNKLVMNKMSLTPNKLILPELYEYGYEELYPNYASWVVGSTGSQTGFDKYGLVEENTIISAPDPWGKYVPIWEGQPNGGSVTTNSSDGGFTTTLASSDFDFSRMYRFSVWIKDNDSVLATYTHFGINTYDAVTATRLFPTDRTTGTAYDSIYFGHGVVSPPETWRLFVGHLWPIGSGTGDKHPDSGIYTIDGFEQDITRDIVAALETARLTFRVYLWNNDNATGRRQWVYPRIDVIDGNEPSIAELLTGHDSRNIDKAIEFSGGKPTTLLKNKTELTESIVKIREI